MGEMDDVLQAIARLADEIDRTGVSRGALAGNLIRVAAWVAIREVGSSLESRTRFVGACRLAFDKVAAGETPFGVPAGNG